MKLSSTKIAIVLEVQQSIILKFSNRCNTLATKTHVDSYIDKIKIYYMKI